MDSHKELLTRIAELEAENTKLKKDNKWLQMEQAVTCDHNCCLGDGNTSHKEWIELFINYYDLSDEEIVEYKEWMDYEEEDEEEEED